MIELTDVSKTYSPGRVALPTTSLRFDRGEFVWLSGRSGSGKSTLLGIASLLIAQTRGTVVVRGQRVSPDDDALRARLRRENFGVVPQYPRLFSELSALQNVLLARDDVSSGDGQRALDAVGLAGSAEQRAGSMSGGEQQRVSIARALVKRPSVIFADEVTSALDDENAQVVCHILQGTVSEGCCVIAASHDPRMAEYADRKVRLDGN